MELTEYEACLFTNSNREMFFVFYIDNIIVLYKTEHKKKAKKVIAGLRAKYELKKGPLEWFLGVRIVRNRQARTVILMYDFYIEKIAHRFELDKDLCILSTPMPFEKLVPNSGKAFAP